MFALQNIDKLQSLFYKCVISYKAVYIRPIYTIIFRAHEKNDSLLTFKLLQADQLHTLQVAITGLSATT